MDLKKNKRPFRETYGAKSITRSYYRKESAAFLPHDLNAKVCISEQFSKGKFTFHPMASFPRFIIGRMAGLNMKVISPMFPAQICFSFII
jgi:hypothetical protein